MNLAKRASMMDTAPVPLVTTTVTHKRGATSLIAATMIECYRETKQELQIKAQQMEALSEPTRRRLNRADTIKTRKLVVQSEASQWNERKFEIGQGGNLKNGWQMVRSSMQDRVGWMFNSWTMCDVVFIVGKKRDPMSQVCVRCDLTCILL
jgi:hypothetical protein